MHTYQESKSLELNFKAITVSVLVALLVGVLLGFITSTMVAPEIKMYISMHGIDATIPFRLRLPITIGNLISIAVGGWVVGYGGMAVNRQSAAMNVALGIIAYVLLSIALLSAAADGRLIHDFMSFVEYIVGPILGAWVAYIAYRPQVTTVSNSRFDAPAQPDMYLTSEEIDILKLSKRGLQPYQIAEQLGISEIQVGNKLSAVEIRFCVSNDEKHESDHGNMPDIILEPVQRSEQLIVEPSMSDEEECIFELFAQGHNPYEVAVEAAAKLQRSGITSTYVSLCLGDLIKRYRVKNMHELLLQTMF